MTKEACEVETLLAQAMASRNGSAGDAMARALAGFATIGNREQDACLKTVNSSLKSSSRRYFGKRPPGRFSLAFSTPNPADFEAKVHATEVLASFAGAAAASLPHEADSPKDIIITKTICRLQSTLARIAHSGASTDASHAGARSVSTNALWQLDYNAGRFWLARLEDPVTRAQTITHFLEMEGNPANEYHGWNILGQRMHSLWFDIANNPSPAVANFLLHRMSQYDLHAFRAACYLQNIPASMARVAEAVAAIPKEVGPIQPAQEGAAGAQHITNPELLQAASDFLFVYQARQLISSPDCEGSTFAGVFSLVMLHNAGRDWLRPMLDTICREMEAAASRMIDGGQDCQRVLNVLSVLGLAGIKTPQGVSASDARITLPAVIGDIAWNIVGALPALNIDKKKGGYADDGLNDIRGAAMHVFDRLLENRWKAPLSMEELERLLPDLIILRNYCNEPGEYRMRIDAVLAGIGARMVDIAVSPGSEPGIRNSRRTAALGIISTLKSAGMEVPYSDFLDASIAFTSDSAAPIPKALANGAATLNPVDCALAAAIYLPRMPPEVLAFAEAHMAVGDQRTAAYARDFIFINDARGMLARDPGQRFAGALALGLLYKGGRNELNPLINELITDSVATVRKFNGNVAGPLDTDAAFAINLLGTFHNLGVATVVEQAIGTKVLSPAYPIPDEVLQNALDRPAAECVLAAGVYIDPMPAELVAFAQQAYNAGASPELKNLAWEFLLINDAVGRMWNGGNAQFSGVQELIGIYQNGRKDLEFMLQCAGAEMADVIMKPVPGPQAENERLSAWAAIGEIEKAGVSLTYHKLHAAPYLASIPPEIVGFAESVLAQKEPDAALAAAARDLLAINDVKALLAKDPDTAFVCGHALSSLAHTGTGNMKDMLESMGAGYVATIAHADNPTRQKAMRVLQSLADLNINGDALFTAGLGNEVDPTLISSAAAIANGKYPDPVKLAAADLVTLNEARRKFADAEQRADGVQGIVDLYHAGRPELESIIDAEVAPAAVSDVLSAGSKEERDAAAATVAAVHDARPETVRNLLYRPCNGLLDALASPHGKTTPARRNAQQNAAGTLAAIYPAMQDVVVERLGEDVDTMVGQLRAPWTGNRRQTNAAAWLGSLRGIAGENLSEGDDMYRLLGAVGAEMIGIIENPQGASEGQRAMSQNAAGTVLATIYSAVPKELYTTLKAARERVEEKAWGDTTVARAVEDAIDIFDKITRPIEPEKG